MIMYHLHPTLLNQVCVWVQLVFSRNIEILGRPYYLFQFFMFEIYYNKHMTFIEKLNFKFSHAKLAYKSMCILYDLNYGFKI